MPRLLDLFCGRLGWSKAFLAKGWECVGVDLVEPPEIPQGFMFIKRDVMQIWATNGWVHMDNEFACLWSQEFDFICASPPCEQFSVHGMKHFHPNPPYPELGIKLFNHTREICEASGVPYVMENVRAAQQFVGNAVHHCGPFYMWGNGVPPLVNQGIKKNWATKYIDKNGRKRDGGPGRRHWAGSLGRLNATAEVATIPPELASCVADYAERLIEQKQAMSISYD
jgi:hypothetical protein